MKFSKKILSLTALFLLLLAVACGNPDSSPLPTQAPIESVKEEDVTETTTDESLTEEETEASTDEEAVEEATETETADSDQDDSTLAPLPRLDQSQVASGAPASGVGGGGGGGIATNSAALPPAGAESAATSDIAIDFVGTDIFEGMAFILDAILPTEPARAPVQQQTTFDFSVEEAQAIATQFGFTGPLYRQPQPEQVERLGPGAINDVYFAFDNNGRLLNIDTIGVYYNDTTYQFESQPNLTLDQAGPIAEAFLQERGLLNFEYTIEKGWGNEIWFKRLIRGAVANQPEITVGLTNNGDVVFVSIQRYDNLERLGNYPLRTAEEAWAILQSGVSSNDIPFNYAPNTEFEQVFPVEPLPAAQEYQYWQRTYEPGQTATIYTWPSVYVSVDGSAPPRIDAYPFVITGDPADLQAIADQPFTQFRFEGTVGENGRTLQLTNWEIITDYPENLYLQGTIIFDNGEALFVTDEGDTYVVPNAPADLPEGERFNLFAWDTVETEGPFPALVWESIDIFINYDEIILEEPVILEDTAIYEPTVYETMTINNVELVYFFAYVFPEFDENNPVYTPPTTIIKPVWQFSGEADNGDLLNFFVDAVAPEFVE